MDRCIEEALAPALGGLAITRILFDVRDQAGIEDALPVVCGIKATIEVEIGASQVQPHLFRHFFQRLETLRQQHHVGVVYTTAADYSLNPKTRYNVPLTPSSAGAWPWYHLSFSTNSVSWRWCASS